MTNVYTTVEVVAKEPFTMAISHIDFMNGMQMLYRIWLHDKQTAPRDPSTV